MRKAAGKRFPHGATSDLVLAVLWRPHMHTGRPEPVSRDELVRAAPLPETTVDDRLRVLVKSGHVMKVRRGMYTPIRQQSEGADRYWQHRPPPYWKPSPKEKLDKAARQVQPPGKREVLHFPEGVVLINRWFSLEDYLRYESARQLRVYTGMGWILPVDEGDEI